MHNIIKIIINYFLGVVRGHQYYSTTQLRPYCVASHRCKSALHQKKNVPAVCVCVLMLFIVSNVIVYGGC